MDIWFVGTGQVGSANALRLLMALAAGHASIVQMPLASLIRDIVEAAIRGKGDAYWYGSGRLAARMAGIEPLTHAAWVKGQKSAFGPGPTSRGLKISQKREVET